MSTLKMRDKLTLSYMVEVNFNIFCDVGNDGSIGGVHIGDAKC